MIILRCLTIGIAYIGIGLGYLPGLRMNRASIAIAGAALLMTLGVLDLKQAWGAIDAQTLIFLFDIGSYLERQSPKYFDWFFFGD